MAKAGIILQWPQIGCAAHTINLGVGKLLNHSAVSKPLARLRRCVGFFHRSGKGSRVLKEKQGMYIGFNKNYFDYCNCVLEKMYCSVQQL